MLVSQVGQAVGLFAITNIDDIVILALLFSRTTGRRRGAARVVAGQYLGFVAILAVAIPTPLGVRLLPEAVIPYFGLLPLLLGIRAGWEAWPERGHEHDEASDTDPAQADQLGVLSVAAVTFANGGDNIAVYVAVFLALVAVWCAAGRVFATRRPVAQGQSRWGHIVLPIVLIALGIGILVEGGFLGL